jgi:putative PIN family toxin of toxin-antitoxin system
MPADAFAPSVQRLVLDTNVWLDLLLFNDPRCAGLRASLDSGRAVALSNAACREEWRRVLEYPGLRLTPAAVSAASARFDRQAQMVSLAARALPWPALPRCRDPDDQKFLELACAADANVLLSRDLALLTLARRTRRLGLFDICTPEALGNT